MSLKINEKKDISIPEVKKILENIKDINSFQQRTFEYAKKFSKVESVKVEELLNNLIQQFGLNRNDAIQIVNSMPTSINELRIFFITRKSGFILTSQLEEILKLIDKYR